MHFQKNTIFMSSLCTHGWGLLASTALQCRRAYNNCGSFFLLSCYFSMHNFGGHWTDLTQVWTCIHIHLWLLFEKFGPNSPLGIYPMGWGKKNAFLGPSLNFDRTYLCNGTWYQQLERNLLIHRDSPTCPPNLVNLGPEMAENGWRVVAHPHKLSHWETLPALPHGRYITDSRQTLARVV